ncbi:MAG: hypothetical protein ACRD0Z_02670 [Acidimicrobiales bacterium]
MAASVKVIEVPAPEFLDQAINAYVVQGFTVANRTPYSVTMVKPKKFEILWAVVGFFLCIIPLLIYLIVYATKSDEVVEIRVSPQLAPAALPVQMSPDGAAWWDGETWIPADKAAPPNAHRSPDGKAWWDGVQWRPTPDPFGKV